MDATYTRVKETVNLLLHSHITPLLVVNESIPATMSDGEYAHPDEEQQGASRCREKSGKLGEWKSADVADVTRSDALL